MKRPTEQSQVFVSESTEEHVRTMATIKATTNQKNAVAYLMQAVGYAVKMNYGTDASGAFTAGPRLANTAPQAPILPAPGRPILNMRACIICPFFV